MSSGEKSFVAFGCGTSKRILMIPFNEFNEWIDGLNITEKEGRFYWHVHIDRAGEHYSLRRKKGFEPIHNLSGHGLGEYETHVPPTIPNDSRLDERVLEDGMAIAIEPFATNGEGNVKESQQSEIFQIDEPKPVRNPFARKILEFAKKEYKSLPFAERWLDKNPCFSSLLHNQIPALARAILNRSKHLPERLPLRKLKLSDR